MITPLTNGEVRRITKVKELAQSNQTDWVAIVFHDSDGDQFYQAEITPELLKTICELALAGNESLTKNWRNSYGNRGG